MFDIHHSIIYTIQEEHGKPLFGVQFNYYYDNPDESKIFASVGANKVKKICI